MRCKKCGVDTWVGVETILCDSCKNEKPPQKDQESEQAQAIAEIRENQRHRIGNWESLGMCNAMRSEIQQCLKIVDSQAQKITALTDMLEAGHKVMSEQAMQIEKLAGLNHVAEAQIERQAMQIAEMESLLESSRSLCSIACDRFEQAKQEAEKYRNAYVETAAPIYGHHPKSLMQASLLPWEDGRIKP